ncbi:MAG TPA: hypothetical protein VHY08_23090 [Bacillota bacterium]|nr:hypothetical protein [Bacillota bacterium]
MSRTKWVGHLHDEYFIDYLYEYEISKNSGKTRAEVSDGFYHRIDSELNILAPVEEQCDWLRSIGINDVDCYMKIFELALFGGRKEKE